MAASEGFMKMLKLTPKKPGVKQQIDQIIQQSKEATDRICKKSSDFAKLADEVLNDEKK